MGSVNCMPLVGLKMGIEWVFRMRILTEYYFWIALFSLCDPKTTWGRGHDACFIHFHPFMPQRGILLLIIIASLYWP